jgi:hypothetical protein
MTLNQPRTSINPAVPKINMVLTIIRFLDDQPVIPNSPPDCFADTFTAPHARMKKTDL